MSGNAVGLPVGTTRLWVTFYGPPGGTVTRDGEVIEPAIGTEAGWSTYSAFVDIDAGDSTEFELRFPVESTDPGEMVSWERPSVVRRSS